MWTVTVTELVPLNWFDYNKCMRLKQSHTYWNHLVNDRSIRGSIHSIWTHNNCSELVGKWFTTPICQRMLKIAKHVYNDLRTTLIRIGTSNQWQISKQKQITTCFCTNACGIHRPPLLVYFSFRFTFFSLSFSTVLYVCDFFATTPPCE